MSTRSTICHGEYFHFYRDMMDKEDHVHLRITESCGHDRTISIPIDIWEFIRHHGSARLDLVGVSDKTLKARAEAAIDKRLKEYRDAPNERSRALLGPWRYLTLGDVDWPRAKQVRYALAGYKKERAVQQAIAKKIATYKTYNEV